MEPLTSSTPAPAATPTTPTVSRLTSLPNELILDIASYLPGRDIARFMRATRHLHTLLLPSLHATIPAAADSILIWAAHYNDLPAALLALKHNADPNVLSAASATPLCIAARNSNIAIVDALLDNPKTTIEFPKTDSYYYLSKRPLCHLVEDGNIAMVRYLLSRGALVYQAPEAHPPIVAALVHHNAPMVALLLDTQSGWKSDPQSIVNSNALMEAIQTGDATLEILELFLKWSAEMLEVEGEHGLFGVAKVDLSYKGYDKILEFLQHYGAPYELVGGAEESAEPARTETANIQGNAEDATAAVADANGLDVSSTPAAS
ncbi:ankyrin repeat-containing domain protein [Morchella snyderi]|nr:ankyrin repeat-containing domain protein [Morchella snyderi]